MNTIIAHRQFWGRGVATDLLEAAIVYAVEMRLLLWTQVPQDQRRLFTRANSEDAGEPGLAFDIYVRPKGGKNHQR